MQVVVEGEVIEEVGKVIWSSTAQRQRIDLKGLTLVPELIDVHVYVIASTADLGLKVQLPNAQIVMRAFKLMGEMLRTSFTTVSDVGAIRGEA